MAGTVNEDAEEFTETVNAFLKTEKIIKGELEYV